MRPPAQNNATDAATLRQAVPTFKIAGGLEGVSEQLRLTSGSPPVSRVRSEAIRVIQRLPEVALTRHYNETSRFREAPEAYSARETLETAQGDLWLSARVLG